MSTYIIKLCAISSLCALTGCSVLDRIQNCNSACPAPSQPTPAQLHASSEEAMVPIAGSENFHGIELANMDLMKTIEEQMTQLTAKDEALQAQLAMLDAKIERDAQERESVQGDVTRISSLVESMQMALENHEDALGGIESHLVDQHADYETLLTGLEKQLGAILAEYEEPADGSNGNP